MPGPTVMVRILGDLTKLSASFKDAESKGAGAAKGLHDAFSGTLAALNKTGVLGPFGEALDGIDQALDNVGKHAKNIGPMMMGVGGALAGIGVGLSALGSKDKAAHQQLQAAVEATGKSYDGYEKQVEGAIKTQEHFGHSADQTQDALRVLTQATGDPAKALHLLNTATDLAAAKHEDLVSAATSLGKVYNGNTKILKEFGITVTKASTIQKQVTSDTNKAQAADNALAHAKRTLADIEAVDAGRKKLTVGQAIQLRNAEEGVRNATTKSSEAHKVLAQAQDAAKKATTGQASATDQLGAKLKGQAAAAADTFGGRISAIKAHMEDLASNIGQKYGPAITGVGTAMAGVGGAITAAQGVMGAFSKAEKGAQAASEGVAAAEDAQAASGWLALGPILLIIAAVAALVAIGYVIYRNWSTIWNGIKAIIQVVWDWIKANWPLLLGILLGPIALAAALIYKYWAQILAGLQAVWHWIASVWGQVVTFLTTPVAAAIHWIAGAWGAVTSAIGGVVAWIRSVWGSLYSALTGTISRAVGWIAGAWGSVTNAVSGIVTTIEGLFGGLVSFVAGLPGKIANAASGMWSSLLGGARSAVDGAIQLWNDMASHTAIHLSIPKLGPFGGQHLDTGQLIPNIPKLAQGGLITREGLIYAHAGEAITPMPGRVGPAVVVQNAHFAQPIDIDLFMQRAAWHVRKAAV